MFNFFYFLNENIDSKFIFVVKLDEDLIYKGYRDMVKKNYWLNFNKIKKFCHTFFNSNFRREKFEDEVFDAIIKKIVTIDKVLHYAIT